MSYLKRQDPELFARFEWVRDRDGRLLEAFEDFETVARVQALSGPGANARIAGIVSELKEELRQRIEACEASLDANEKS